MSSNLSWYAPDDEDEREAFMRSVDICISAMRLMKDVQRLSSVEAQKRINKVKKAFADLTDDDKQFLDGASRGTWLLLDTIDDADVKSNLIHNFLDGGKFPLCKLMQKSLDVSVPSSRKSINRSMLVNFARIAVRKEWVGLDDSTDLTALLTIVMKEAGVKHDARDIALESLKIEA